MVPVTADAILIAVSFILSGAAMVLAWQTIRYARQAREARERAQAAYQEIRRSRGTR